MTYLICGLGLMVVVYTVADLATGPEGRTAPTLLLSVRRRPYESIPVRPHGRILVLFLTSIDNWW